MIEQSFPSGLPYSHSDHLPMGILVAQEADYHQGVRPQVGSEFDCTYFDLFDPPEHGPDKPHLQITSINGTNSADEVVIISAHQDRYALVNSPGVDDDADTVGKHQHVAIPPRSW